MDGWVLRRVRPVRLWATPAWPGLVLFVALFVATLGAHNVPAAHHGPVVPVDYCLTVVLGSVLLLKAGEALLRQPPARSSRLRFPAPAVSAVAVQQLSRVCQPPLPTSTTVLRC